MHPPDEPSLALTLHRQQRHVVGSAPSSMCASRNTAPAASLRAAGASRAGAPARERRRHARRRRASSRRSPGVTLRIAFASARRRSCRAGSRAGSCAPRATQLAHRRARCACRGGGFAGLRGARVGVRRRQRRGGPGRLLAWWSARRDRVDAGALLVLVAAAGGHGASSASATSATGRAGIAGGCRGWRARGRRPRCSPDALGVGELVQRRPRRRRGGARARPARSGTSRPGSLVAIQYSRPPTRSAPLPCRAAR